MLKDVFIRKGKKIIITQIVIIAAVVIAGQAVGWLSNQINNTANQYATNYNTIKLNK